MVALGSGPFSVRFYGFFFEIAGNQHKTGLPNISSTAGADCLIFTRHIKAFWHSCKVVRLMVPSTGGSSPQYSLWWTKIPSPPKNSVYFPGFDNHRNLWLHNWLRVSWGVSLPGAAYRMGRAPYPGVGSHSGENVFVVRMESSRSLFKRLGLKMREK